jgi:ligand-binding sensor domain-containing protein
MAWPATALSASSRTAASVLWICTPEGLSGFDGYQFTNYRTEQGLPGNYVSAFLETRRGIYWVGTSAGLSRFDPTATGAKKFQRYTLPGDRSAQSVTVLGEDRHGAVWCGTNRGWFRLAKDGGSFEPVELDATAKGNGWIVNALLEDRLGALWVGTGEGLYRREPGGRPISLGHLFGPKPLGVLAILEDREGRMWFGTTSGLWRIDPAAIPLHLYPKTFVYNLLQSADGRIWIGATSFLAEWIPRAGNPRGEFGFYGAANGLSGWLPLTEDRDGNLWIVGFGSGLLRMARNGFITYSAEDGLRGLPTNVGGFFETRRGELCFFNRSVIHRFDGRRFVPIHPGFPRDITYFGWGYGSLALQDREGDWWIATGQGLCRFPPVTLEKLAGLPPKAIYRTADGLPGDNIFQIFEDSHGDIWIGIMDGPRGGMAR